METRQEGFDKKAERVSPAIQMEVQLSAEIIARIDILLEAKKMTQRDLARKLGKSEAAVSRWTPEL